MVKSFIYGTIHYFKKTYMQNEINVGKLYILMRKHLHTLIHIHPQVAAALAAALTGALFGPNTPLDHRGVPGSCGGTGAAEAWRLRGWQQRCSAARPTATICACRTEWGWWIRHGGWGGFGGGPGVQVSQIAQCCFRSIPPCRRHIRSMGLSAEVSELWRYRILRDKEGNEGRRDWIQIRTVWRRGWNFFIWRSKGVGVGGVSRCFF